jgi:4-amino-4-deoxy-L-arabinose transferase-like glycosyltransferase
MQATVCDRPANPTAKLALFMCLCVGAFLRIHNFWLADFWLDEYSTWWVTAGNWADVIERAIRTQGQSPFYFLVVKLFTTLLGEGFFQLRLPSVLFGVTTLFTAYKLAVEIFHDPEIATTSTAIFAVNEHQIWISQAARPYALALLLTLTSFLLCLKFARNSSGRAGIGYAITTALLIYSHFIFGFVVVVQIVIVALRCGWRELLGKKWLLAWFSIAILCLPLTSQFLSLYGRRDSLNWIPHFSQSYQASATARAFAEPWALLLATIALIKIGIKPTNLRDPRGREPLTVLSAWLLIPAMGLWMAATVFGVSFLEARYLLFIYPAAFYLWAWVLLRTKPADWHRFIPSSVFLIATFSFSLIPHAIESAAFRPSEKLGWKQAGRILTDAAAPNDLVVIYTGFVEADLFARTPDDDYLLSYVGWPLIAHLPREYDFSIASLPLLQNERTDAYIKSVELKAAKHDRVWVVAPSKQSDYFNSEMRTEFGFHPIGRYPTGGKIQVTLLGRALNQSGPGKS